ncbi:TPA: hypothetical protein ACGOVE_001950 [Streptococcus suis]
MLVKIFDKKIELSTKNIMNSCSNRDEYYKILAEREESRLFYECHVINRKQYFHNHLRKVFVDELSDGLEVSEIVERIEYYIDSANSVTELKMIYELLQECFTQFNMSKENRKLLENTVSGIYCKLDSFIQSAQPVKNDIPNSRFTVIIELKKSSELLQECSTRFKIKKKDRQVIGHIVSSLYCKLDSLLQSSQLINDTFPNSRSNQSRYSVTELKMIFEVIQECSTKFKIKRGDRRLLERIVLSIYYKLDDLLQSSLPVKDVT